MYRVVKCPADEAAGTQRLARPDFPSLGRGAAFCPLASIVHSERPPAESGGPRSRGGTGMNGEGEGFISPINFVDSGWRKNWVKSHGRISSIFSRIPIIPLRASIYGALSPFYSRSLHEPPFMRLQPSSRDTSRSSSGGEQYF